ncbi:MAG TPA: SHOCT domain-containing protein, partial [Actinotalea sp.]|nr:SHOCT domain-containing protein [Actinotalea sp.]
AEQAFSLGSPLRKDRTAPPPPPPVSAEKPDVLEQLSKLAALRDAGVVTEDEFAAKKAELLSRM